MAGAVVEEHDTFKSSRFNRRLEGDDRVLYHNTLYGSLISVLPADSARIDAIFRRPQMARAALRKALPHLADILFEHEFLIPEERDELEICRALFTQARHHNPQLRLAFILGYDCNFRCGYCFQRLSRQLRGTAAVLSDERFEAFVRFIEPQLAGMGKLDVSWMGGEPLLFTDRIVRFGERLKSLSTAHHLRFDNLLITNGYGLTKEVVAQLAVLPNLKMQITIDGLPEVHDRRRPHVTNAGSFWVILENVERCLRGGIETHIRVNVDDENASGVTELIALLQQTELARWPGLVHFARAGLDVLPTDPPDLQGYRAFSHMERAFFASGRSPSIVKLPELTRVAGCPGLGRTEYLIDPEGRIFKCPRYTHDPAYAVAEVAESGEVVVNAKHARWLAWSPFDQRKCRRCSLLPLCMGGCPFNAVHGAEESLCGETRHYYATRMLMQYAAQRPAEGSRAAAASPRRERGVGGTSI